MAVPASRRLKKASMKHSESFNLILLGDPASGKGTQAARLIKKYHLYDFDMGREVRKPQVRAKFNYAKTTGVGKLTPTAVVRDILSCVIPAVPSGQGILFNGHPKMINEAKLVSRLLKKEGRKDPFVIYLHIPVKETIRRAASRLEYVNGKHVKRDDDSLRALRNRRRYYEVQIAKVRAYFKQRYSMKRIDGMGSEAAVGKRILAAVEHYKKKHAA